MKLLADEGIDAAVVVDLRDDGHDVLYVAELSPGMTDDEVLDLANGEDRVLLTADKDFGELVYRLGRVTSGVVLVRLAGLSPESRAHIVSDTMRDYGGAMAEAFCVITPKLVRIRHTT